MPKKSKARKKIKQLWSDLYSGVSFDGFHYIFEVKGFLRLFWLVIVLAATFLGVFLFYGVMVEFLTYKVTQNSEEVKGSRVEFPTVTICNLNSLSKSKFLRNTMGLTLDDVLDFYQEVKDGEFNANDAADVKVMNRLYEKNITELRDILTLYEYTMEEMLQDDHLLSIVPRPCLFKNVDCTRDDFIEIISAKYGLCYQFNSIYSEKNRLFVHKAGEGEGLRLFVNIPDEDLMISTEPFTGLQVFIHPFGEPFESVIAKRIPIPPGKMDFIYTELYKTELLPDPYPSKCSTKPFKFINEIVPYTRSMCTIDCAVQLQKEKCGCIAEEMIYHASKLEETLLECGKDCPFECQQIKYKVSTGQTNMGNRKVIEKMKKDFNMTEEEVKNYLRSNIYGLDVSFADIEYKQENESPTQNWISVLSAIGGSLGLAMGCSLVSFIEFFVFAIRALYLYIRGDNAVIEPDDDDDEDDARNKKNDIRQTEIGYIRKGLTLVKPITIETKLNDQKL